MACPVPAAAEAASSAGAEGLAEARPDHRGASAGRRVGRWTKAPFRLPEYAIHSVMLPTGKLLFWGFPSGNLSGPNVGNANIWDPSKGYGPKAFTNVHPPVIDPDGPGPQPKGVAPIYCSGQSLLANGEVLVTGGNLEFPDFTPGAEYPDWAGLNRAFIFDPWTLKWTEQPRDGGRSLVSHPDAARRRPHGRARRLRLGRAGRPAQHRARDLHPGRWVRFRRLVRAPSGGEPTDRALSAHVHAAGPQPAAGRPRSDTIRRSSTSAIRAIR